jgi:hypothetical protein
MAAVTAWRRQWIGKIRDLHGRAAADFQSFATASAPWPYAFSTTAAPAAASSSDRPPDIARASSHDRDAASQIVRVFHVFTSFIFPLPSVLMRVRDVLYQYT